MIQLTPEMRAASKELQDSIDAEERQKEEEEREERKQRRELERKREEELTHRRYMLDCNQVYEAFRTIHNAHGTLVDVLADGEHCKSWAEAYAALLEGKTVNISMRPFPPLEILKP